MKSYIFPEWDLKNSKKLNDADLFVTAILKDRDYLTDEQTSPFLNPGFDVLNDPFEFRMMQQACDLIRQTMQKQEKIVIYGDYDVDGMSATVILFDFLKKQGALVDYIIPNRITEEYGLNIEHFEGENQAKTSLLITVDCGIKNIAEIQQLKKMGMKIIITDHHEAGSSLPLADAILNSNLETSGYPFTKLCGAATALKVVIALSQQLNLAANTWQYYLPLVAIATIADMMPLVQENRALVVLGFEQLKQEVPLGLEVLIEKLNLNIQTLTSTDVAFFLAPKLNAAGRLGKIELAMQLLMADDRAKANIYAEKLLDLNEERKDIVNQIITEACDILETKKSKAEKQIIILCSENWHIGVLGIVSTRISELFQVPSIILTKNNGVYMGSGRGYGRLSILEAVEQGERYLLRYGGHKAACGLKLLPEQYAAFKTQVENYCESVWESNPTQLPITANYIVQSKDITKEQVEALSLLEPFGLSNEKPLFCSLNLKIQAITILGKGDHYKIILKDNIERQYECIFFNVDKEKFIYQEGDMIDILYYLTINKFRGFEKIQFQLQSIKLSSANHSFSEDLNLISVYLSDEVQDVTAMIQQYQLASTELIIKATEIIQLYKALSSLLGNEKSLCELSFLVKKLQIAYNISISIYKLMLILKIYAESGLIHLTHLDEGKFIIAFNELKEKVVLQKTLAWQLLNKKGGIIDDRI